MKMIEVPADLWKQVEQLVEGLPVAALGNAPTGQVADFVRRVRAVQTEPGQEPEGEAGAKPATRGS